MTKQKSETLTFPPITPEQTQLRAKQKSFLQQYYRERRAAVLSYEPIDEQEAENLLRQTYRAIGLEPVPIRWFDSPPQLLQALIFERNEGENNHQNIERPISLSGHIHRSIYGHIHPWNTRQGNLSLMLHKCQHPWPWNGPDSMFENSFLTSLQTGVLELVGREAWIDQFPGARNLVTPSIQAYIGMREMRYYRFLHEVIWNNDMLSLAHFNDMVSGYYATNRRAWVVRKPIHLQVDEQGRLHNANGQCLEYRDGKGFYSWHGVMVPQQLILHPEQITREDWLNEQNLEVRRAIQECIGGNRFVEFMGGMCIDSSPRGELIAVHLTGSIDDPERVAYYAHVKDTSTDREYYLRVPPSIKHADEAIAWTFGLNEDEYQPIEEA